MRHALQIVAVISGLLLACGDDGVDSDATSGGSGSTGAPTTLTGGSGSTSGGSGTTASPASTGADETTGGSDTGGTTQVGTTGEGTAGGSSSGSSTGPDDTGSTGALDCTLGERVYQGDGCNFCDCTVAGLDNCTTRTCVPINNGCDYNGMQYAYAEIFDSTDRCNECVCAASGLACTRRPECVDGLEEGAILLEALDDTCADIDGFTGQSVLDLLEPAVREGPLDYANTGPLYPETLPDTTMTVRVTYDGGYIVCRIPAPGQEALDIEAIVEWQTADGAFDEGQQTYIRDNAGGFVDAITTVTSLGPTELYGTYDHDCLDAGPLLFGANFFDDDTADGNILKICETDIALTLGDWASPG